MSQGTAVMGVGAVSARAILNISGPHALKNKPLFQSLLTSVKSWASKKHSNLSKNASHDSLSVLTGAKLGIADIVAIGEPVNKAVAHCGFVAASCHQYYILCGSYKRYEEVIGGQKICICCIN